MAQKSQKLRDLGNTNGINVREAFGKVVEAHDETIEVYDDDKKFFRWWGIILTRMSNDYDEIFTLTWQFLETLKDVLPMLNTSRLIVEMASLVRILREIQINFNDTKNFCFVWLKIRAMPTAETENERVIL